MSSAAISGAVAKCSMDGSSMVMETESAFGASDSTAILAFPSAFFGTVASMTMQVASIVKKTLTMQALLRECAKCKTGI